MLVSVLDLKLKVTFKYSHFFTLKKIILSLSLTSKCELLCPPKV